LQDRSEQPCGDLLEFDSCTGFWNRANAQCLLPHETGPVSVVTDHDGLRLAQHSAPAAAARSVAILGDSVTFGWGVQPDASYPARLGQAIDGATVRNLGLLGGGPDQSLLALRCKEFPRFDVIVVAPLVENIVRTLLTVRDGRAKPYFALENGALQVQSPTADGRGYTSPPESAWSDPAGATRDLLARSALYKRALPGARHLLLSARLFRPYRVYYEGSTGKLLLAILVAIAEENKAARVIYAPLPTYHYIEYDVTPDYERVFREAARVTGGDYVDVLARFKELGAPERRAARFPIDQHYSASGHAVVADVLRPAIVAALQGSEP
jgi:hypothetical protein